MRSLSVLGLMGFILALAVTIAVFRNADDFPADGLILGKALFIGLAALAGVCRTDRRRAARLGLVAFGGGYFALAFLSGPDLARLPTTWLLDYFHQRVEPTQAATWMFTGVTPGRRGPILLSDMSAGPMPGTITTTTTSLVANAAWAEDDVSGRWRSLLPGAASYEAFGVVGHCPFALVAGLPGSAIALRFRAGREGAIGHGPEPAEVISA